MKKTTSGGSRLLKATSSQGADCRKGPDWGDAVRNMSLLQVWGVAVAGALVSEYGVSTMGLPCATLHGPSV